MSPVRRAKAALAGLYRGAFGEQAEGSARGGVANRVRAAWAGLWSSVGARPLLLVMVPVAACALAMKGVRLARIEGADGWHRALGIVPDLLLQLGVLGLAITLLGPERPVWRRRIGLVSWQLVALLVFAVDVLAFGYFRATGTALDYTMFAFSLGRVAETAPVVGSEVTLGTGLAMAAVPLWMLIAPWVLGRSRAPGTVVVPARAGYRWLALLLAFGCFAASSQVAVAGLPASVVRDPLVHLAMGYLAKRRAAAEDTEAPPAPRRTGPTSLAKTPETRALNVVLIVLESTRADATTPYTPKLKTTPALAALAKSGTVVERAYAIVPHTSKALVAILCGIEPRPSLDIVEAAPGGMPAHCLARLLAGVGYDTAFFQAPKRRFEHREQLVKNMGYAKFVAGDDAPAPDLAKVNYFGYEDAVMLEPSRKWLAGGAKEPFFATYLTSTTHHPYGIPPSHPTRDFGPGRKGAYLNALSYVDGVVGRIVDQYKAAGLFERSVFVVVGDHGEGFNEHHQSTHDDVLYEEGLRVPLLVRAPEALKLPRRVAGPVNQLSIAPTVLALLGLRPMQGEYEAGSLYADDGTRPLYASCYRNAQCLGVVHENRKLLHFFDDKPTLLFDLATDPKETKNLAKKFPDLVEDWTWDLTRWTHAVEAAHAETRDALLATYVRKTPPAILQPIGARFGRGLEVLQCTLLRHKRAHLGVSCDFRVLARLGDGLRLRVKDTARRETKVFDHKPVRGLYPLHEWKPGDYITDSFEIRPPRGWERRENVLCLVLEQADGKPVPATPAPSGDAGCVPIGVVPARP